MLRRTKQCLIVALLILAWMQIARPQTPQPEPSPMTLETPQSIVAAFVGTESEVRDALKQYTFKREVVLQTIGSNGQVTGQYISNSQFLFDEKGNRIERVSTVAVKAIHVPERSKACFANHNAPPKNGHYWRPDTNVKVYFGRGLFTKEERAALLAAMKIWSDTAEHTDSGVSFSFSGETDEFPSCRDCLTVARREVYKSDRKRYAFFRPSPDRDGLLTSASIVLDFATTKPQALQGFMVHELGHGLGLWDCRSCKKKKTIMNSFPGINKDNGLIAPSPCDLEVVRQVYELQRRVDKNKVTERKQ